MIKEVEKRFAEREKQMPVPNHLKADLIDSSDSEMVEKNESARLIEYTCKTPTYYQRR